jgi:hypothetical protein
MSLPAARWNRRTCSHPLHRTIFRRLPKKPPSPSVETLQISTSVLPIIEISYWLGVTPSYRGGTWKGSGGPPPRTRRAARIARRAVPADVSPSERPRPYDPAGPGDRPAPPAPPPPYAPAGPALHGIGTMVRRGSTTPNLVRKAGCKP